MTVQRGERRVQKPRSGRAGVTTESRGQSVANALRRDIVRGRFQPGERITEEQLGECYSVSRVPVREALRVLEAEGFLEIAPYKGVTVARPDPEEAADLFAVREVVEGLTAARAASRRTPEDLTVLNTILELGNSAMKMGRLEDLPGLNTQIHLRIADIGGSTTLSSLWKQLSSKIEWLYAAGVESRARNSWSEHVEIVAAIEAGDAAAASKQMRAHVANSRKSHLLRRFS